MSGITGIFNSQTSPIFKQDIQTTLNAMTDSLAHRGPDANGVWFDTVYGIGLGHRCLALRDKTTHDHQPMISSCGRYVIVCDGVVYSHREITKQLEQHQRYLKSTSDAELILEACAQWGIESALKKINGIFAFALYDKKEKTLFLARDRIGVKPLFYGYFNGLLIFGSELKALRANPNWEPRLDRNALAAFMRHRYVPTPYSIYQQVYKLPQGCILEIKLSGEYTITSFWDFRKIVESNSKQKKNLSDQNYLTELHALLKDAVKQRMTDMTSIGSLLSSGIDSSLITALMATQSSVPINTFTIGFHEAEKNEAPFAKAIAKHLGTQHTELYMDAKDAFPFITNAAKYYDEPLADQSQIPTLFLCQMAKQHSNVVLTGDGADILFGGMSDYYYTLDKWTKLNRLPYFMRLLIGNIIKAAPYTSLRNRVKMFQTEKPEVFFRSQLSVCDAPETFIKNAYELKKGIWWDNSLDKHIPNILKRLMLIDMLTILPDQGLSKMDRAAMRVGLEIFTPFLDFRIVEFASQFPDHLNYKNQTLKWGLRQILSQYIPHHLIDNPKRGFSMPLNIWLAGPLKDWAESLLNEKRLKSQNLFEHQMVSKYWQRTLKGKPHNKLIWNILMAQAWIDANPEVSI